MAETLIYVQDHHYDTRLHMQNKLASLNQQLEHSQQKLHALQIELKNNNEQIHFTGQYYANKKLYQEMIHSPNKAAFRRLHPQEISDFEEARKFLKSSHPDNHFPATKELKQRKSELQELINQQKSSIQELGNQAKELQIASDNVDAMLDPQPVQKPRKSLDPEIS